MSETPRVLLFGLGPIGAALARECLQRGYEVVGGVDIDPAKIGRDVGEVVGADESLGLKVAPDIPSAVQKGEANVVLHAATSYIWEAHPQLAAAFQAGANVVSTCEELAYPWRSHRHFAQEIDQAAKWEDVTALGTGVNPGFVMDTLVIALSSVCRNVTHVTAQRVLDASHRRLPLQQKIGIGLRPKAFAEQAKEGKIGHVGTYESIDMIGAAFGWNLRDVTSVLEPVVAEGAREAPEGTVASGLVAGIRQVGRGMVKEGEAIRLELEMSWGAPNPMDSVTIDGEPGVVLRIPGGLPGEEATIATVVNAIPRVMEAEPGLKTILDLPLPRYVEPPPPDL
ncbi:MAG: dihydrodipicolinate reductase [Thermoplasmata archaeon]